MPRRLPKKKEIHESIGLSGIRRPKDVIELLDAAFGHGENILATMNDSHQFFITHRGRVVAILSFMDRGAVSNGRRYSNMIYNVATHPDFRRRSWMRQLLEEVIRRHTHQAPLHLEVLEENRPAVALYESLGFRIQHRWMHPTGKPTLLMRRRSK